MRNEQQEKGSDAMLGDEVLAAERKRIDLQLAEQAEEDRLADAQPARDDEPGESHDDGS